MQDQQSVVREIAREVVREEIAKFRDGLERSLSDSMVKALDTVESENRERIRRLEEDVAELQRRD